MILRREQMDHVNRVVFFEKLHRFLRERLLSPELRTQLQDRTAVTALWLTIVEEFDLGSEYRAAILLSYAWFQHCAGVEARRATAELLRSEEAEYHAKCYFETNGIFRFSEFDIAREAD